MTKAPKEVQDLATEIKDVLKENGTDILKYAVDKMKPDMSFEDPKTINRVDITQLKPEQRVAYYLHLQEGSAVNKFLGDHYGDNLYAKNQDDLRVAAQPRKPGDQYPDDVVQKDIDGKIRKLEKMMTTKGDIGTVVNTNIGSWMKDNDSVTYDKVRRTFDSALFGVDGDAETGAGKYKSQTMVDALTGLSTTTVLAQTYLDKEDFDAKNSKLSTTFNDVMSAQLLKAEPGLRDTSKFAGSKTAGEPADDPSTAPPLNATDAEYKKWYDGLTENSGSKRIQPIVNESFNQSDIATKLKEAGYKEGSDTWNEYKTAFTKDVTLQYNNYWGNIRKNVKLDVVYSQVDPVTPRPFDKLKVVAGVDAEMFRAGAFHTVQNATLSAALAGSIIGAEGNTSDPKTAMTLTYAVTNLADMVAETASKYLDPKSGAFKKVGLNKDGNWTKSIANYLPGGDFKAIEAAGKMVAGAGTAVFGATALWKTVDAVKNGDAPAAVFNALNAAGSTIAGTTLAGEGVLQLTNVAKNYAMTSLGYNAAEAASFDAAARGALGTVGFVGGIVAGLALTGLGIYDLGKQAKVLDRTLDDANKKYIAPTTGWKYEFLFGPDSSGSAAV